MTIINILKDGTVVDDMSQVTVPKEIIKNVYGIYNRSQKEQKRKARNEVDK